MPMAFETIPYDLSTTDDFWNKPITTDELNFAIQLTKNIIPGKRRHFCTRV